MNSLYAKLTNRQAFTRLFVMLVAMLFVLSLASGASAAGLKTRIADRSEVQGTFTVMLYGGISASDPENVAILKPESDGHSFEIAARGLDYKVVKGLSAEAALAEAEKFLGNNIDAGQTQLVKILGTDGAILGFEVKSLYEPERFGMPDVVDTHYTIKGDTVRAWINIDPEVGMALNSGS